MLAALAVLAVVSVLARTAVASPVVGRLRALFPSWRFFDRATGSPALHVRHASGDGELGAWASIDDAPRGDRRAIRWAFAPAGNLGLAYHAVIEQLVAELGELTLEAAAPDDAAGAADPALAVETDPAVLGLTSYQLAARIARAHAPAGARLQWKLVVPGAHGPIDYLLSPVLPP